jgi:hypothetical protein
LAEFIRPYGGPAATQSVELGRKGERALDGEGPDRAAHPSSWRAARAQFASAPVVDARMRDLERDGVHRHGEKGHVCAAERDVADGRAFLDRAATTATSSGSSSPPRDQAAHIRTDPSPSSECTSAVEALRLAGIVERIDAIADACLTIFPSAASPTILPGDGADARVNEPSSIGLEWQVNYKGATGWTRPRSGL